jgi:GWxTD domain-containing protein
MRRSLGLFPWLLGAALASAVAAAPKSPDPADLTNFRLGPEYAQWLVGAVAHLAGDGERGEFLALREDAEAAAFIEAFWERRGPNLAFPPTGPRISFDQRAEEADRRFSEGTFLGRRTDRGTIFVLYGAPTRIDFASSPTPSGDPVEVWVYDASHAKGLDDRSPERRYAFRRDGAVTKFFPVAALKRLSRTPRRGRDRS